MGNAEAIPPQQIGVIATPIVQEQLRSGRAGFGSGQDYMCIVGVFQIRLDLLLFF